MDAQCVLLPNWHAGPVTQGACICPDCTDDEEASEPSEPPTPVAQQPATTTATAATAEEKNAAKKICDAYHNFSTTTDFYPHQGDMAVLWKLTMTLMATTEDQDAASPTGQYHGEGIVPDGYEPPQLSVEDAMKRLATLKWF